MSIIRTKAFIHYVIGILCVGLGAEVSSRMDSMLPLAMGSAMALMVTAGLVRAIRSRKQPRSR